MSFFQGFGSNTPNQQQGTAFGGFGANQNTGTGGKIIAYIPIRYPTLSAADGCSGNPFASPANRQLRQTQPLVVAAITIPATTTIAIRSAAAALRLVASVRQVRVTHIHI